MSSMNQVIWLCRHGIRIDYIDADWRGDDPHLSKEGVIQAQETGERLQGEGIRHLFASPFLRTVETAHHIAEALDLDIKVEHGATEWLNKDWFAEQPEYTPFDELKERFPRIDPDYKSTVIPHYPESPDEVLARAGKTARILANTYSDDILIVGHGRSVYGMGRGLAGVDCDISAGLCALVKIVRRNEDVGIELNGDKSHLSIKEEPTPWWEQ